MRTRSRLLSLASLLLLAGCGGGGGSANNVVPNNLGIGGAKLRSITSRSYTVVDLGQLAYYWPGWFLSPGASSISLNDQGQVVSAMNYTPYLWTSASLTTLTGNFTAARAINDQGQVIGDTWSGTDSWPQHAGVWQNGNITDLGSLSTDPTVYNRYSYAFGINNHGDVVGELSAPSTGDLNIWWWTHAFLYSGGSMIDLGALGGSYCRGVAVNNNGQVVGYGSTTNNVQTHAFFWQHGQISDMGVYPGGTYSQATGINDGGQVVGFANKARTDLFGSPPPRATLWQNGQMTDLGTLGGPGAYATGINNDGIIIGSAETSELRASDQYYFGYYYDYYTYYGYGWIFGYGYGTGGLNSGGGGTGGANGNAGGGSANPGSSTTGSGPAPVPGGIVRSVGITPPASSGVAAVGRSAGIGFAGGANGAKGRGRAAGDDRSYYVAHAFVYADSTMFDLNRLLPGNSDWELTQTTAINAQGQIVGIGTFKGQVHGFLLTPQ